MTEKWENSHLRSNLIIFLIDESCVIFKYLSLTWVIFVAVTLFKQAD